MANIIESEIRKRSKYPNGKQKSKYKKKEPKPYDAHKGKSVLLGKKLTEVLGGYNERD